MHLWTFKNIIMLLLFYNYSWTSFCIRQMVYDLLAIGQKEVHVFRWLGFSFLWVSWKVICLMWDCTFVEGRSRKSKAEKGGIQTGAPCAERLLLNHESRRDSWPPEENSIQGHRRGLIAQSFCVMKFYWSIKGIETTSDIDIRRRQREHPLASVSNGVISFN